MDSGSNRHDTAPPFPVPFAFPDVDGAVLAREAAEEVAAKRGASPRAPRPALYSAARAYASSGAHEHTRLRSP